MFPLLFCACFLATLSAGHGWADHITADGVTVLAPNVFSDDKRNAGTATRVGYGSESGISEATNLV